MVQAMAITAISRFNRKGKVNKMKVPNAIAAGVVFVSLFAIHSGVAQARQGSYGCCKFETRDELEISVEPGATHEKEIFRYTYSVVNLPSSHQGLFRFSVIFLNTGVEILGGGSSFGQTPAFPKPSTLQSAARGKAAKVGWAMPAIAPGKGATFEFSANSAPVITDYYYEGDARRPRCSCEESGNLPGYDDLTPYGPGRVGKTLGPGTYPSNRHEYIVALKKQFAEARKLGWVRSTDAAKEIEEAFGNIQTEMQRGLWYKTTIPVFLAKLKDMKNNKQINAETYYLLSVNLDVMAGM